MLMYSDTRSLKQMQVDFRVTHWVANCDLKVKNEIIYIFGVLIYIFDVLYFFPH